MSRVALPQVSNFRNNLGPVKQVMVTASRILRIKFNSVDSKAHDGGLLVCDRNTANDGCVLLVGGVLTRLCMVLARQLRHTILTLMSTLSRSLLGLAAHSSASYMSSRWQELSIISSEVMWHGKEAASTARVG